MREYVRECERECKLFRLLHWLSLIPKHAFRCYRFFRSLPLNVSVCVCPLLAGHAYYVDMCGRPTVIQKCATCGVDIGGENHNLLKNNVDLDESLKGNDQYNRRTKAQDNSGGLVTSVHVCMCVYACPFVCAGVCVV